MKEYASKSNNWQSLIYEIQILLFVVDGIKILRMRYYFYIFMQMFSSLTICN